MREPFEEVPSTSDFVRYRLGWFMLVVGLLVAAGLIPALLESQFGYSIVGSIGTLRDASQANATPSEEGKTGEPSAVATAGAGAPAGVVHEIATLTNTKDTKSLIGREVELTVPVLSRANDQAFWVGSGDDQLLVVVRRDNRDAAQRYYVTPAANHIAPLQAGQQAAITGTIQPVPYSEAMYSWGLSTDDVGRLESRAIYIDAQSVHAAQ